MLTPEERLGRLEKILEELKELSDTMPIIVEGRRDVAALKRLGISRNIVALNEGSSIFSFCESLSSKHATAVVLTDWDKRGGQIARRLKEALKANGVTTVEHIRIQLVILSKKEVKDIESLPTFIGRLRAAVGK